MVDYEVRQAALEEIAAAHDGALLADDVLAAATALTHPLHPCFEWTDSIAAHKFRLEQARSLIRSVEVRTVIEETTYSTVRYVQNPREKSGYITVARAQSNEEIAHAVVKQEFERALHALQRARDISIVLHLRQPIDDIIERLEELSGVLPVLTVAA